MTKFFKCPNCNHVLKFVHEYEDSWFLVDLGKEKENKK